LGKFLELAPNSPWADEAQLRLEGTSNVENPEDHEPPTSITNPTTSSARTAAPTSRKTPISAGICGASADSGWEDADWADGEEDEDDFDYDDYLRREFPEHAPPDNRPNPRRT
jgi:hypothetical protein